MKYIIMFFLIFLSSYILCHARDRKIIGYKILDVEKKEGFNVAEENYQFLDNMIFQAKSQIKIAKIVTRDDAIDLLSKIEDIIKKNNFSYSEANLLFFETLNQKKIDCDTYCYLYLSLAESLNLPLFIIILPQHMLILCEYNNGEIFWETTSSMGNAMSKDNILEFYNIPEPTLNNGIYLKKINSDSLDFIFYNNIGLYYAFRNKNQEALRYFNLSINICNKFSESFNHRAIVKYALGDTIGSINDCYESFKIIPNFAAVHNHLAFIAEDQGKFKDAIEHYYLSQDADERNKQIQDNFNKFKLRINYIKEIFRLDKAIKSNPKSFELYFERGLFRELSGEYHSAIKDFSEVIKINNVYSKAYVHRGLSFHSLKNDNDAMKDFKNAIKIDPKNYSANKNLLWVLFSKKNYSEAYKQAEITFKIAKEQGFDTFLSKRFLIQLKFLKDK